MRGRKPKPTRLKELTGNPGKRALPTNEPKPPKGIPPCPPHLGDVAKLEYRRLAADLDKMGLISKIDGGALASYCSAYETWVEAEAAIKERAKGDPIGRGLTIKNAHGGEQQNPMVLVRNKAQLLMAKIAVEFGLTPSSRVRLAADAAGNRPGGDGADNDEFFDDGAA